MATVEMSTRPHILLIEDQIIVALAFQAELVGLGYTVDMAATGEGAVEAAARTPPAVLIVDVNLRGGMDGLEAARRIQQQVPCAVIVVTGYDDPAIRGRAARLNPLSFMIKPVDLAAIAQVLSTVGLNPPAVLE